MESMFNILRFIGGVIGGVIITTIVIYSIVTVVGYVVHKKGVNNEE